MAEDSDGALVGNPAYGATEIIACQLISSGSCIFSINDQTTGE
jgi:hypothetical protein